ncbi:hypothetical protein GIB67_042123 [Kingdonia uniflora]|uniref:NAD-dependent epimerase/dehydratase domain-containing protein n=1 Tax=Kingdonia uniflora TaxID=39325 RepID=A0A7J7NNS2_9MAGN|nr:hypothetical protein GIB67_042123 [Kingdonia uniflora]
MNVIGKAEDVVTRTSLEGTLGILKACVKAKTVKRVVVTSSAASIIVNSTNLSEFDESVWIDFDMCKAINLCWSSYSVTKTLTEQAALDFAKEHGVDLATLIPSSIVGPFINPNLLASNNIALALIYGNRENCHTLSLTPMVHVDDVASAYIFLSECPKADGRYICSHVVTPIQEFAKFLSIRYPEFPLATDLISEVKEVKPVGLSSKKLLDLGFKFSYGPEEMMDGAIQSCKEKGFL